MFNRNHCTRAYIFNNSSATLFSVVNRVIQELNLNLTGILIIDVSSDWSSLSLSNDSGTTLQKNVFLQWLDCRVIYLQYVSLYSVWFVRVISLWVDL